MSKLILFSGLFFFSIRCIYASLIFYSPWNQHYSIAISAFLGFNDIELFDAIFGFAASLMMATIEYSLVMKLWRRIGTKHKDAARQ